MCTRQVAPPHRLAQSTAGHQYFDSDRIYSFLSTDSHRIYTLLVVLARKLLFKSNYEHNTTHVIVGGPRSIQYICVHIALMRLTRLFEVRTRGTQMIWDALERSTRWLCDNCPAPAPFNRIRQSGTTSSAYAYMRTYVCVCVCVGKVKHSHNLLRISSIERQRDCWYNKITELRSQKKSILFVFSFLFCWSHFVCGFLRSNTNSAIHWKKMKDQTADDLYATNIFLYSDKGAENFGWQADRLSVVFGSKDFGKKSANGL